MMMKKAVCVLLALLISFSMTGCWNYRGLNEMTLVAGVAVDKVGEKYYLTFEIIDLTSPTKEGGIKAKLIESEGNSIFEAVRNAKKRAANRLYFGNTQIVILSREIVSQDGVESLINWFLRDAEVRETAELVVSQEETAKMILAQEEEKDQVVSYEIIRIIEEDENLTGSTVRVPLYEVFNRLKTDGTALILPAFHLAQNDRNKKEEANGAAVFRGDKLVGFMSPEEAKIYLLLTNRLHGGILTGEPSGFSLQDISLEMTNNQAQISHSYQNGKLIMKVKIKVNAYLAEYPGMCVPFGNQRLTKVQTEAKRLIREKGDLLIKRVQTEYDSDIFGFGESIYRTDLALWKKLKGNWDETFQTLDVEIEPEVHILDTSLLR